MISKIKTKNISKENNYAIQIKSPGLQPMVVSSEILDDVIIANDYIVTRKYFSVLDVKRIFVHNCYTQYNKTKMPWIIYVLFYYFEFRFLMSSPFQTTELMTPNRYYIIFFLYKNKTLRDIKRTD